MTGGAGFIGSHVADACLARDYEVLVIDDLSTGSERNVPAAADVERLDIVDEAALARAVSSLAPTAICHLAAQASVTVSVRSPAHDLSVNVCETSNVLQAAKEFTRRSCSLRPRRSERRGRADPDSRDQMVRSTGTLRRLQLAAEAYVATWGRLHGVPDVVLRLGNVYGPRQSPHGEAEVVAIFSERLRQGEAPLVYGDGCQTRD